MEEPPVAVSFVAPDLNGDENDATAEVVELTSHEGSRHLAQEHVQERERNILNETNNRWHFPPETSTALMHECR